MSAAPASLDHDAFYVDQLFRPVANLYRISTLAEDARSPGEPVAFVRQKRLALKEDLRFFRDETETEELFRIKARRVLDVGRKPRYDVLDPAGERIGVLQHDVLGSLLRTRWSVLDADEREVAWAREKSLGVALFRRLSELVPLLDAVPVAYHFTIIVGTRPVGELRRLLRVRDRYVLDLSGDLGREIDRRLAVALAVALDALQQR